MYHTEEVLIKSEPPDPECNDTTPIDNQTMVHNVLELMRKAVTTASIPYMGDTMYQQNSVENLTVKIEPKGFESEEEQALDLSRTTQHINGDVKCNGEALGKFLEYNIKVEVQEDSEDDMQLSKLKEISKTYRKRVKEESDEEYIPPKKKKKKKKSSVQYPGTVKKSYTRKTDKPPETIYPESVLNDIEIVTITEDERQIEHKEMWHSRKHMQYTCEPCAAGFVVEDAYAVHMKAHSPSAGDHECELCHTRLKNKEILYRHRLRHYRRYRCRVCHRLFKDKDTAACHVNMEHARLAFVCSYCDKKFKRPQYLKKHIEQMHTKEKRYECPICHVVVYEKGRYRSHVRSHSDEVRTNTSKPTVVCDYCYRSFQSKPNLKRHLRTHEQHDETVACTVCTYACKSKDVLRVHVRRMHGQNLIEEEDCRCRECLRVFASPALMRHHARRMHSDRVKRYQCDYCQRLYLTKGEVRAHIAWSHMRAASTSTTHACGCGRVFRTPARLRAHAERDHLNLPRPREHECTYCGKAFAEKQVLKRHMRGHTNETYPCKECGLSFKTQSYVTIHYKLKHLNMTRAQIRAQTKPRRVNMVTDCDEKKKPLRIKVKKDLFDNVDVKTEDNEDPLHIPLFETFVDVQCLE